MEDVNINRPDLEPQLLEVLQENDLTLDQITYRKDLVKRQWTLTFKATGSMDAQEVLPLER